MNYTAWLEDGTRIDSSLDSGEPLTFALGSEQVFEGWNEAVALMQVGDTWQVIIPSDLALGSEGAGQVIPPDANLVMQLELLELLPAAPAEPAEVDEQDYTTTESGLQYVDIEEGDGEEVGEGDEVTVHYTGWLEDGTRFDSSYNRGQPLTMVVGSGQVIPGWDEGLVGMKAGGKRQLRIPPDLGYGEEGAGEIIPPDATLIFDIELQSIGSTSQ
jgi:peptidylprolyl isomerase